MSFNFKTIEDIFIEVYSAERSLVSVVSISAIFTILIALFGLFGLTLFVATTRTKEIGIKKVLSSSVQSILCSLLYQNVILVLIATMLSVPVTIHFMTKWLNNYSYRLSISWWVFLAAFIAASSVVVLTVFFHSYKMSRTNPADAFRYE
jgi:putative ABC transport system permease protein